MKMKVARCDGVVIYVIYGVVIYVDYLLQIPIGRLIK